MGGIIVYCSNCGVMISERTEICPKCGVKPFRTKDFCYSCGERNFNKYLDECTSCGVPFNKEPVSALIEMSDSMVVAFHDSLTNGLRNLKTRLKRE